MRALRRVWAGGQGLPNYANKLSSSSALTEAAFVKLIFQRPYLSLDRFEEVELPQFTILTGVNGSGKSHLFKSLKQGYTTLGGIPIDRISYFNNDTFRIDQQNPSVISKIEQRRKTAWEQFLNGRYQEVRNNSQNQIHLIEPFIEEIQKVSKRTGVTWWSLEDLLETDEARQALRKFKLNIDQSLKATTRRGNVSNEEIGYRNIFTHSDKFPHEIDENSFRENFRTYQLKEDFLPEDLSSAFAEYYFLFERNQYNRFRNETYGEDCLFLDSETFQKVHGPPPWDVINEAILAMRSIPYAVNSPVGIDRYDEFTVELRHLDKREIKPNFTDLSSGERILLALVASIYKGASDKKFPSLLLLDEIDASLHPSMVKNLFSVIQDVFLTNGTAVILATHSPTTVALAEDESVYVMQKAGFERIQKSSRAEAIETLSEGFATLNLGLSLFDQVSSKKVSIISEGYNSNILDRFVKLSGLDQVEIITGLEHISGKNQLKTIFDFFSKVPHENKVIFVWDCDATAFKSLKPENNTFPFVFDFNNKNTLAKSGIENLFREELLSNFQKTTHLSDGTIINQFDSSSKARFSRFIIERNEISDFDGFESLGLFVRSICQA